MNISEQDQSPINFEIVDMLETRDVLSVDMIGRVDEEPEYITRAINCVKSMRFESVIYGDIEYLVSVLKTQLEITVLLKENSNFMLNQSLKRNCFRNTVPTTDLLDNIDLFLIFLNSPFV